MTNPEMLLYSSINLGLFIGILYIVYRKKGAPALVKRAEDIRSQVGASARNLLKMEGEIENIKNKLGEIQTSKQAKLDAFQHDGEQEAARIEKELERRIEQEKKDFQNQKTMMESRLENSVQQQIIDRAFQNVPSQFSEEDKRKTHENLIQTAITQFSSLLSRSSIQGGK
jgi:F0F1-type ATP synthase membrane subunit b/b'